MHLTRNEISRVMPVPRKGTRYIARPRSHVMESVTVLAAVRDMLHLARTAREVNEMIKDKKLKINGRVVRDSREPLVLMSIFEADKVYRVHLLPTGRFTLEPTKTTHRIGKVISRRLVAKGAVQVNLSDGTNFISKEKISIGDSVELDTSMKILKVIPLREGSKVLIRSGRNRGTVGTVSRVHGNSLDIALDGRVISLNKLQAVAL